MLHRVAGIDGEVENDLVDLARIGVHVPQAGGEHGLNLNIFPSRRESMRRVLTDVGAQVEADGLQDLAAAEGEQLAGERRRRAAPATRISLHRGAVRIAGRQIGADHFGVAFDHGEQVVEVVRNAAGQLPYRFQLLGLAEFLLEAPAFGDVGRHHQAGGGVAELYGMGGDFHEEDGAVLGAVAPRTVGVQGGCGNPRVLEQLGDILRGPYVAQGHAQEFLARVAVAGDGRVIDGQKGEGRAVVHPHGLRIGFEQEAVAALRFLQLALRAAAQGDVAEDQDDAGDRCRCASWMGAALSSMGVRLPSRAIRTV